MKRHQKIHEKVAAQYECENCGKEYIRNDHFIAHKSKCLKETYDDVADFNELDYSLYLEDQTGLSLADLSMAFDDNLTTVSQ